MGMNYMNWVWIPWKLCEKGCHLQATEPPLWWDVTAVGDPGPQVQKGTSKSMKYSAKYLLEIFFC